MPSFLRTEAARRRVTSLELFFDLVFVFAITQLSHTLIEHLTWEGAAETLFLLLVVWSAWIYTTWMANWFDPDSFVVRGVLIVVMLASLLMSIGIPDAFGDRGLLLACSYVALAIYLFAHVAFRWRMAGTPSGKRLAAAVACCAAGVAGAALSALATAALVLGILVVLMITAERLAGIRRGRRGEPGPLERLEASAETVAEGAP